MELEHRHDDLLEVAGGLLPLNGLSNYTDQFRHPPEALVCSSGAVSSSTLNYDDHERQLVVQRLCGIFKARRSLC